MSPIVLTTIIVLLLAVILWLLVLLKSGQSEYKFFALALFDAICIALLILFVQLVFHFAF